MKNTWLHSVLIIAAAVPVLAVTQWSAIPLVELVAHASSDPQQATTLASAPSVALSMLVPGLVLGWFTRRHPLVVGAIAGVLGAVMASELAGVSFGRSSGAGDAIAAGLSVAVAALAGRALQIRFQLPITPPRPQLKSEPADTNPRVIRPTAELLWLLTVDQGKQLEFNARFDGLSHPLATVVADAADESLWLQLSVNDQKVQIPLALVDEAIKLAPGGVQSEMRFEKNFEDYSDPGLTVAARSYAKRVESTIGNL